MLLESWRIWCVSQLCTATYGTPYQAAAILSVCCTGSDFRSDTFNLENGSEGSRLGKRQSVQSIPPHLICTRPSEQADPSSGPCLHNVPWQAADLWRFWLLLHWLLLYPLSLLWRQEVVYISIRMSMLAPDLIPPEGTCTHIVLLLIAQQAEFSYCTMLASDKMPLLPSVLLATSLLSDHGSPCILVFEAVPNLEDRNECWGSLDCLCLLALFFWKSQGSPEQIGSITRHLMIPTLCITSPGE